MSFDAVAAEYDAVRPDYPAQLFDALESAMGQPLLWSQACDVGAGTGIAARALAGRGSTVVAVDPGHGVLSVLASRSTSRVRPVVGRAEALPLCDNTFDVVTFAQSFHWADPPAAIGEALRVLKPGGVLAVWWNRHDLTVPWFADHQERLFRACGIERPTPPDAAALLRGEPWNRLVATVEIPWSRRISLDDFGRNLATQSYVFRLGEQRAAAVVAAELAELAPLFPSGTVEEPFTTYAVFARN